MKKRAFIYTDDYAKFQYGSSHPLKPFRLKLTYELMKSLGLHNLPGVDYVEPSLADEKDLLLVHDHDYIDVLKILSDGVDVPNAHMFGLGYGDNPIFPGMYEWSLLVTGASLEAARLVMNKTVDIAFNISGGLHHAMPRKASGFCYVNDPAVIIEFMRKQGKRVAYVDIDAHHGDGVQEIFYENSDVLTISIHEVGYYLFPGTGYVDEMGRGDGYGYSVNMPLPPGADDEVFLYAFDEVVPPCIQRFKPDIIVTQLGVDTLYDDPLAHLNLSIYGFAEAVKRIKNFGIPWVALGGGGYDIASVAKAWTVAWGIMNEKELPHEIPQDFLLNYEQYGFDDKSLYREKYTIDEKHQKSMKEKLKKDIERIKESILPLIKS